MSVRLGIRQHDHAEQRANDDGVIPVRATGDLVRPLVSRRRQRPLQPRRRPVTERRHSPVDPSPSIRDNNLHQTPRIQPLPARYKTRTANVTNAID